MNDPIIILAPPHSFTSVVGAMLGQHPDTYGLPEVNLFVAETMEERRHQIAGQGHHQHGLLRVVAQLFVGNQTPESIDWARCWLANQNGRTCISVFRELGGKVSPRILLDKSPRTTLQPEYLQRIRQNFPNAKFIHLLRHPTSHGESMWRRANSVTPLVGSSSALEAGRTGAKGLPVGRVRNLRAVAAAADFYIRMWYRRNMNIVTFLDGLPEEQKMRVRGEDLLSNPHLYLVNIASWLRLRTDASAIDAMMHPERSPYAGFGPPNARFGNNRAFLQSPVLRTKNSVKELKLDAGCSWRGDRDRLSPEQEALAREFGYD